MHPKDMRPMKGILWGLSIALVLWLLIGGAVLFALSLS